MLSLSEKETKPAITLANSNCKISNAFDDLSNAADDSPNGSIISVGKMQTARAAHTATVLKNGKVLIVGGFAGGTLSSAEIYDPASKTFKYAGHLSVARAGHSATLLPNDKVLIAGGYNGTYLSSTEIFDPQTQSFSNGPAMTTARSGHPITGLNNGKILFAGGVGVGWSFLQSAELYNISTNSFSATGSMTTARESHTATLLKNGTVLVTGGHKDRRAYMTVYSSAEIYNPSSGKFESIGNMMIKRHKHDAIGLADGKVLITGGSDERDSKGTYSSAELYDPQSSSFKPVSNMNIDRYKHNGTSILLSNGNVLIAGGANKAEIFNNASRKFEIVQGSMGTKRLFSCATRLPNGDVLITGGYNENQVASEYAWIYSYKTNDIKTTLNVGNAPGSVEIADFNNDKLPDLAVTSETDSSVTILLGNGNGNFMPAVNSPFYAGPIPNDIAVGDFNNDENMDLAIANHEKQYLTVLPGNGVGNFIAAHNSTFPTRGIPHTHGVAAGDFNNDGRLDLATDSWGNDQIEIFFGDSLSLLKSQTEFFKVGKRPYQRLRAADLNNDGIDDIVTTNTEGNNVTVLIANGKGGFIEATGSPFACGDSPFGIAIGDLNADGKPDLAIINSPGSMAENKGKNGMTVLLGDGKGKFTIVKGSPFESGKIPNRIAIGDINGDGVNDVVTSDNSSNKIYVFKMNKKGDVSSQSAITVGNHPKGIAIADLNGDGKGEIVVCNNADNNISLISDK